MARVDKTAAGQSGSPVKVEVVQAGGNDQVVVAGIGAGRRLGVLRGGFRPGG